MTDYDCFGSSHFATIKFAASPQNVVEVVFVSVRGEIWWILSLIPFHSQVYVYASKTSVCIHTLHRVHWTYFKSPQPIVSLNSISPKTSPAKIYNGFKIKCIVTNRFSYSMKGKNGIRWMGWITDLIEKLHQIFWMRCDSINSNDHEQLAFCESEIFVHFSHSTSKSQRMKNTQQTFWERISCETRFRSRGKEQRQRTIENKRSCLKPKKDTHTIPTDE